jgi:phosphatidylglycerol---prolipoprotein diacylglyceryl transferase
MTCPYYIHNLDPVLLQLWGPLAIRWYGLAYLAGFLSGYAFLYRWARQGSFRVAPDQVQTLMLYVVVGIMVGGRLGYALFYDFASWRADPALIFRLWEGGMASHGGMIGLVLAVWLFARTQRVPFLHVTDALVVVAGLGIFFGRIANFINGELWGRVTDVRWAVLFPQSSPAFFGGGGDVRAEALRLYEAGELLPRHPSQLYAAAIEGLLLFAILWTLRRLPWGRRDGRLSVAFLVVYAAGRITVEFFREPEIVHAGGITQGQLLSLLLLVPAAVVWFSQRLGRSEGGE